MDKKKVKITILIFILPFFLSACWDYKEVERRAYVLGIAIDKSDSKYIDKKSISHMDLETTGNLYDYTIEIPLLSKEQGGGQSVSGSHSKETELTATSNSFFQVHRYFSSVLQNPANYGHLKAVVISEAVAREGIKSHMDVLLRDPELRRIAELYITADKAKEILNVQPEKKNEASDYLNSLASNQKRSDRIVGDRNLGFVSKAMHLEEDYVLPRVMSEGKRIKNAGAAVFKDNKMIGWLDEIKTKYLRWITGEVKGSEVSINMPESKNEIVTLELVKETVKIKPLIEKDSISMTIDIKAVMNIQEIASERTYESDTPSFISEIESLAEEDIKKNIKETISYIQNEYGVDIFGFRETIKRKNPKQWGKLEGKWDDIIKNMDVKINVDVKIEQHGLIK